MPPILEPIAPPMVPPPGMPRPATVPINEPIPLEDVWFALKLSIWLLYCVFMVLTAPCRQVCVAASHCSPVPMVEAPVVVVLLVAPTAPSPALPAT